MPWFFLFYVTVVHVKERKKSLFSKCINYNTNQRYKSSAFCAHILDNNCSSQTMFKQCSEMTKDKMQKFDKNGTKRSNYLIINTLGSFQDQNRQAGNDYFVLFVCCFKRGTCRSLQY